MEIIKKLRDEGWLRDEAAEVAVPFEMVIRDGACTVEYYPSAEKLADEFIGRFGADEATILSDTAVDFAVERFGAFLREYGFEISPDCGDVYVNYALTNAEGDTAPFVVRLHGGEGYTDLTDSDIDGLTSGGYIIYAAVVNNNIASVANTGVPVEVDTENEVEIGVDTAEDYRRQGYGKACVKALCLELLRLGHTPIYECAVNNTASVGLAQGLGGTELYKKFYIVGFRDI